MLENYDLEQISDLEYLSDQNKLQFTVNTDSNISNENNSILYIFTTQWGKEISSLMGTWISQKMEQNNTETANLLI